MFTMGRIVENEWGDGAAEDHPEIVAALIAVCAADFDTAMQGINNE